MRPPVSRAALARCVAARLAGRVTRCVPGRFPGPLHSAGTDRFAGGRTRRLSGDGRLGGYGVLSLVLANGLRIAARLARSGRMYCSVRPPSWSASCSVTAVGRLRSQPALATSGWGPCSARCVAGPVAGVATPSVEGCRSARGADYGLADHEVVVQRDAHSLDPDRRRQDHAGGVALGGRGLLGACGLVRCARCKTARCVGCTARRGLGPDRRAARCGRSSSVLLGPRFLLGACGPCVLLGAGSLRDGPRAACRRGYG